MTRDFCTHGHYDGLKGAVHGAMLVGAICCFTYNATPFFYRRERHNGVNALLYLGLTFLEVAHVKHHMA